MRKKAFCHVCGKEPLTKNEIGLTKKLLNRDAKAFFCLSCLAEYLEVDEDYLREKVQDFKDEGCTLF